MQAERSVLGLFRPTGHGGQTGQAATEEQHDRGFGRGNQIRGGNQQVHRVDAPRIVLQVDLRAVVDLVVGDEEMFGLLGIELRIRIPAVPDIPSRPVFRGYEESAFVNFLDQ